MTSNTATIEIPRLPNESARAHAAKVAYVTAGPGRSLEKTRQLLAKDSPGYTRVLKEWSARHDWAATARAWDDQQAAEAIRRAGEAYRAQMERHRTDAMQSGQALYGVAIEMLATLRGQARTVEYTPAALATIARALTVALDLQAHALRLDAILPELSDAELD